MSPELEGHYCRFDLDTATGQGLVWSRRPVDLSETIASGQRKINGRFVDSANLTVNPGIVVATFEHELGGDQSEGIYYPDFSDLSGYLPCPVDDDELLRQWKKTLKQKIPSLLPSRYELVNLGDGEWYVTDQESGDLVWTHQASPEVIGHAREITG